MMKKIEIPSTPIRSDSINVGITLNDSVEANPPQI